MCDAVGLSIPDQVSLKQTLRRDGSSVTFAVPVPFGSPFGVSDLPLSLIVKVLFAALAETASASTASSARPTNVSFVFKTPASPRANGQSIGHRSHDYGHPPLIRRRNQLDQRVQACSTTPAFPIVNAKRGAKSHSSRSRQLRSCSSLSVKRSSWI